MSPGPIHWASIAWSVSASMTSILIGSLLQAASSLNLEQRLDGVELPINERQLRALTTLEAQEQAEAVGLDILYTRRDAIAERYDQLLALKGAKGNDHVCPSRQTCLLSEDLSL